MRRAIGIARLFVIAGSSFACYTSSTEPQALETTPSFAAVVTQVSHDTAYAPGGFQLDQYELFVVRLPGSMANAGLILGPHANAFRPSGHSLHPVSRGAITVGDTLEVWADTIRVAYGSVQAPEGAPAYIVDQVVIRR
jgi:hypothetical protein